MAALDFQLKRGKCSHRGQLQRSETVFINGTAPVLVGTNDFHFYKIATFCPWRGCVHGREALGALGSAGKRASARLSQKREMWNRAASPLEAELVVSSYPSLAVIAIQMELFLSSPFSLNLSLWYREKRTNYSKCLCCIITFNVFSSGVQLCEMAKSHRIETAKRLFSHYGLFLLSRSPGSYLSLDLGPFSTIAYYSGIPCGWRKSCPLLWPLQSQ